MPSKPKLIPLRELRALCKRAGVRVIERTIDWDISYRRVHIWRLLVKTHEPTLKRFNRQMLKAYCLGLIAMRERGEL